MAHTSCTPVVKKITPLDRKTWRTYVRRGAKLILESDGAATEASCAKDPLIKKALKHYEEHTRFLFNCIWKKVPLRHRALFANDLDKITTR
jgi:hypothetical protein